MQQTMATSVEQRLTPRQAAIIGLYTGILLGPREDMATLAGELLGSPAHDTPGPLGLAMLASSAVLRERLKPLFEAVCAE